jgi:hypothetical protein
MSPEVLALLVAVGVVAVVALAYVVWKRGGPHSDEGSGGGS